MKRKRSVSEDEKVQKETLNYITNPTIADGIRKLKNIEADPNYFSGFYPILGRHPVRWINRFLFCYVRECRISGNYVTCAERQKDGEKNRDDQQGRFLLFL